MHSHMDPAHEPPGDNDRHAGHDGHAPHEMHGGHEATGGPEKRGASAPYEVMGHGGHHGGGSMADMARDMRNRFLVAAVLSVPIVLWSPIGREVFGFTVAAPFGLRDDMFSLI